MSTKTNKKWTEEEDKILLRQVKAFPQNLTSCFLIVSEQTGRTQQAVSNRWYTKVSKDPASLCFFTASPKHVSTNRKNGDGIRTNRTLWQKFVRLIRNL